MAEPSSWPVASFPIAAQAYSRGGRQGLSPSLANRLRIGFAIVFAVITALTVFGVAHIIQQRQDYENGIERSYRTEMVARVKLAEGVAPKASRRAIARQEAHREELRHSISDGTRNTVILVAAGLLAGLIGALLLFAGLIATMRRPLEALVGAAGRVGGGGRSARGAGGGPGGDRAAGA